MVTAESFKVIGREKVVVAVAKDAAECQKWVKAITKIKENVSSSPLVFLLCCAHARSAFSCCVLCCVLCD
jgi:hypothetical protein